jgi:hypothetical protein
MKFPIETLLFPNFLAEGILILFGILMIGFDLT